MKKKTQNQLTYEKFETENKSFIEKLKKEKKLNDEVLTFINLLSLEDLLTVKLELTYRMFKGKFYGFPIFDSLENIVKDSVVKVAKTLTSSKKECMSFLGLTEKDYAKTLKYLKTFEN